MNNSPWYCYHGLILFCFFPRLWFQPHLGEEAILEIRGRCGVSCCRSHSRPPDLLEQGWENETEKLIGSESFSWIWQGVRAGREPQRPMSAPSPLESTRMCLKSQSQRLLFPSHHMISVFWGGKSLFADLKGNRCFQARGPSLIKCSFHRQSFGKQLPISSHPPLHLSPPSPLFPHPHCHGFTPCLSSKMGWWGKHKSSKNRSALSSCIWGNSNYPSVSLSPKAPQ